MNLLPKQIKKHFQGKCLLTHPVQTISGWRLAEFLIVSSCCTPDCCSLRSPPHCRYPRWRRSTARPRHRTPRYPWTRARAPRGLLSEISCHCSVVCRCDQCCPASGWCPWSRCWESEPGSHEPDQNINIIFTQSVQKYSKTSANNH